MSKFVLNDERIENSYGFKIKTAGIDLTRFLENPVMLDDHYNSTDYVIGKWNKITKEGGLLTAEPEFDQEDDNAKRIEGKVKRGYLKGCSMGISYDRAYMKEQPDGSWVLEQSELFEGSICAIPSNAGSLRLYDAETKKLMSESDIKLSIQQLQSTPTTPTMEKIKLSIDALKALGLTTQPETAIELDQYVLGLSTKLKNEQDAHQLTKDKLKAVNEAQATSLIDQAVLSGKITASEKESWKQMAMENLSIATSALAKIPAKVNLSNGIITPNGDGGADDVPKTQDEFEKLSLDAQLAFKKEHPEAYKALWK